MINILTHQKNKKIVIGSLHFMPLVGYNGFPGYNEVLRIAFQDLKAYREGGVDAVILENNYNLPHRIKETVAAFDMMLKLSREISKRSSIPLGISVLWNDYESALKIAKEIGAKFIRVPVFVDSVATDFGKIVAQPQKVRKVREILKAKEIMIFSDIHVKHAEPIDKNKTIAKSAHEAMKHGSDAIIITGKWTGEAPKRDKLIEVRKATDLPIFIGSGASKSNIKELMMYSDGAIVSTSLKESEVEDPHIQRNVKSYKARVSKKKVDEFIHVINTID